MLDIEIIKRKGINVIDSKLLHKKLEVASYHKDWIRRRIENYGFKEGEDFYCSKLSGKKGRGGHNRIDYFLTLDMAKELAMLENNDIGKTIRKYFIKAEKQLRKHEAIRLAGIETRKTLTDKIQESNENDRMHGHGYSTYTMLVYKLTGLSFRYKEYSRHAKEGFRESLTGDDLKRVEMAESIIKPLLEMGKQYEDIKETLEPLFEGVTV